MIPSRDTFEPFELQLSSLRADYAAQLAEKIEEVEAAWKNYVMSGSSAEENNESSRGASSSLILLHRLTHSLAGSGATFGFPEVSRHARCATDIIQTILTGETEGDSAKRQAIETALHNLREAVETKAHDAVDTTFEQAPLFPEALARTAPFLLVFSELAEAAAPWISSVRAFGYAIEMTEDAALFAKLCARNSPSALLFDCHSEPLQLLGQHPILRQFLSDTTQEKNTKEKTPPVIWMCRNGAVDARLQAVRLGGSAFFTHPVDMDSLLIKLDDLISIQQPDPIRVLIVDDDPALARFLAMILHRAGIEAREVTDPFNVMEPLVDFAPDLILMDVYMPHCTGTELAAVIRQQEAFVGIPIVFLSVETNVNKQMEAMRQGGDDFLIKPMDPRHLVSAITARVARARVLRNLMQRDSLTGLLNHTKTKEQIEVEVERVRRMGHSICLAMIDIDYFKRVNDNFGHAIGDRVLRSLSRLLIQRLRQTDVIGRYGGEEFAVILNGTTDAQAKSVLEKIRESFGQMRHIAGNSDFAVTFSAGIASAPPFTSAAQLSERADKALYEAKAQGRNRICVAPSKPH